MQQQQQQQQHRRQGEAQAMRVDLEDNQVRDWNGLSGLWRCWKGAGAETQPSDLTSRGLARRSQTYSRPSNTGKL